MNSTDEECFRLEKKIYETQEQFAFRKGIYEAVYEDTHELKKALIYSNIWVNILMLECEYPQEIMDQIEKYKPKSNIYT